MLNPTVIIEIEEIGQGVLHMAKVLGLDFKNPHHFNAIASVISEMFAHHKANKEAKQEEKQAKAAAPKSVVVNTDKVIVKSEGDK